MILYFPAKDPSMHTHISRTSKLILMNIPWQNSRGSACEAEDQRGLGRGRWSWQSHREQWPLHTGMCIGKSQPSALVDCITLRRVVRQEEGEIQRGVCKPCCECPCWFFRWTRAHSLLYIVQLLSLHISDSKQAILLNISIVALEAYMPLQLYYFLISHRQ